MNCPACGQELPDSVKFCPECGASLGTPAPEPDPAPPSAAGQPAFEPTMSGSTTVSGETTDPGAGAPVLEEGTVFDGRYRIEGVLGRGGMGAVYLAQDDVTNEKVCLKLIRSELVQNPTLAQRFLREGKLTRALRHRNIVAVYDVNAAGGNYYLSMEFLEGLSLRSWLQAILRDRSQVPLTIAIAIIKEILSGLAAAHDEGVVHRDLKPENVMLTSDPAEGPVKLKVLDFGIARALDSGEQLTVVGATMGTPAYMAPEQELGADAVGPEADLYSVGAMFYELLMGIPPRGRWELPTAVRNDLDPAVDGIVEKALAGHPARRYQTVGELTQALESLSGRPVAGGGGGTAGRVAGGLGNLAKKAGELTPGRDLKAMLGEDWPESIEKKIFWSYIPGTACITWKAIHKVTAVNKHQSYFWIYLVLGALGMLMLVAGADEEDEELVLTGFMMLLGVWMAGAIHLRVARPELLRLCGGGKDEPPPPPGG